MRRLSLCLVSVAAVFVTLTGARLAGFAGALVAGVLFALSPNVLVEAAEIRAYPLLLLASAAAFYWTVRLLERPYDLRPGRVIIVTICILCATYSHFYGLILGCSLLLSCLVVLRSLHANIKPVLIAGAVVGVAATGLVPFILHSLAVSGTALTTPGPARLFRLVYRLVGHPSISVNLLVLAVAAVGSVLAGIVALLPRRKASGAAYAILLALATGLILTIALGLVVSSFDAYKVSYSTWMLPGACVLFASALDARWRMARTLALLGLLGMTTANLYGAVQLATHSHTFARGPHNVIAAVIHDYCDTETAIVHELNSEWAWVYFPICYDFGLTLAQYRATEKSADGIRVVRTGPGRGEIDLLEATQACLIVISAHSMGWSELRRQIRGYDQSPREGPASQLLDKSPDWHRVETRSSVSYVGARIDVFERTPRAVE
jgi:hypothetical protein